VVRACKGFSFVLVSPFDMLLVIGEPTDNACLVESGCMFDDRFFGDSDLEDEALVMVDPGAECILFCFSPLVIFMLRECLRLV